jgi:nucleotide-binding universal stress UspA family protein
MYKMIVVGFDGQDRSATAVRRATGLATSLEAKLHIVTAVAEKAGIHKVGASTDEVYLTGQELAKENLLRLVPKLAGADVSYSTASGDPAAVLVSEAERLEADLIVVGNKNVRGLARVLGNVANEVLKKAECAVLIENTD